MKNPLLLTALLLPAAALAAPKAAPPAPPPGLSAAEESLVSTVNAHGAPSAEYLFLLDTSGGLLDPAKGVRDDVASLIAQIPAGDRVEVVFFHTRYTVALDSTIVTDANRASLVDQLRARQLVSSKETDLGAGLTYAATRLARPDAAPIQFLYIASTFCHDPSITSDFDSGGRGCRSIRGLEAMATTFAAGHKGHALVTTLFPMDTPTRPVDAMGLDAVHTVFGDTQTVLGGAEGFHGWATTYGPRLPLERVAPLARADAANVGLTVKILREPTAQKPSVELELSSGARYLPMKLTGLVVTGAAPGALPGELLLDPTARLEVPLQAPTPPLALLPGEDTITYPVTLSAQGALEPEAGLAAIQVDSARPALTATAKASWHRTYGLPIWLVGILFAGILATTSGLALVIRRRLRKVRLGGTFSYRQTGGPRQTLDISDLQEAHIVVGADGTLAPGPRSNAILVLRMVKQGLDAYAEAEILADGIEINRKPTRRGRVRVVPGATSFQFGEHRLSWE